MSGDVPDVRGDVRADDGLMETRKEDSTALIQLTVIAGVFATPQTQEIIERLTDAVVEVEGENTRRSVWCVIEEVANCEWGIGGQTLTSDDVKALARAGPVPQTREQSASPR
jgi:4-oxalocrotonate tautomerase